MKILIDAFGGDNSPEEIVKGAIEATRQKSGFTAVLVGDENKIKKVLGGLSYDNERISILHAGEVITCEEEPALAVRRKPDSSICVAFKELKMSDEAVAFVSAGSTGAVLVGATLRLGRNPGVLRPALCPILPTIKDDKNVLLLDAGANADCKKEYLVQFAQMGVSFAKTLGVENPKVALLSNGTEDEKGNALTLETFPILKEMDGINFVGNMEARDILSGEVDVVVCDGFSGNVALKSLEGAVKTVMLALKQGIYGSLKGKVGGALIKKPLYAIKDKLDYNKKGGAIFLGVNKIVIKAHGSSHSGAFKNAVLQAVEYAELNLNDKMKQAIPASQGE